MKISKRYILIAKLSLIVFMASLMYGNTIFSQTGDYYLGQKRYSFINYDSNFIYSPKNNSGFVSFYHAIDSIIARGTGKIQVLHIGGSHIQADIYTHIIRKRFQSLSQDMNGGRGLIFPYRIAKTNGPSNFRVTYDGNWLFCKNTQKQKICNLGITGYSVTTYDSLARITIDINRDSTVFYTFNSVRIFHDPTSYQLIVRINEKDFTGNYFDTLGYTQVLLDDYYSAFQLKIQKDSTNDAFTLQGISFDNDNSGLVYNSVGVNGAMLKSYLSCNLYKQHLIAIAPQLVIFSIGTNDAYTRNFSEENFKLEYRQLLDSTLEALPNAQILITVPNDSYLYKRYLNSSTAKMREIIIELAKEYNCGVWDFYTIMGGLNSVQAWYSVNMMKYDKVHFNREGYLLKGELFFSAFLKAWEEQFSDIVLNKLNNE